MSAPFCLRKITKRRSWAHSTEADFSALCQPLLDPLSLQPSLATLNELLDDRLCLHEFEQNRTDSGNITEVGFLKQHRLLFLENLGLLERLLELVVAIFVLEKHGASFDYKVHLLLFIIEIDHFFVHLESTGTA